MDPHTGVLPSLKVMVDRSARWKFAWQQSPLAACPQEVKDGVEDGTKVGWCAVAHPVAPPAELAQSRPTPRWSGRCRRIESASHGPFGPGQRSFKTDVNFFKHPLSPASLKAELERRKELSDTRSELERRLMAFRSLRLRNFPIMRGSVARTKPSSPLSMSA